MINNTNLKKNNLRYFFTFTLIQHLRVKVMLRAKNRLGTTPYTKPESPITMKMRGINDNISDNTHDSAIL